MMRIYIKFLAILKSLSPFLPHVLPLPRQQLRSIRETEAEGRGGREMQRWSETDTLNGAPPRAMAAAALHRQHAHAEPFVCSREQFTSRGDVESREIERDLWTPVEKKKSDLYLD